MLFSNGCQRRIREAATDRRRKRAKFLQRRLCSSPPLGPVHDCSSHRRRSVPLSTYLTIMLRRMHTSEGHPRPSALHSQQKRAPTKRSSLLPRYEQRCVLHQSQKFILLASRVTVLQESRKKTSHSVPLPFSSKSEYVALETSLLTAGLAIPNTTHPAVVRLTKRIYADKSAMRNTVIDMLSDRFSGEMIAVVAIFFGPTALFASNTSKRNLSGEMIVFVASFLGQQRCLSST